MIIYTVDCYYFSSVTSLLKNDAYRPKKIFIVIRLVSIFVSLSYLG